MTVQYTISINELKALLELLSEVCKRTGLDESITRSLFRKLNEKDFR